LSLLRQGLGAMQTPPNQVIVGLALFLSAFTMAPVAEEIKLAAYEPYDRKEITEFEALSRAIVPLERFMLRQTREADLSLFYSFTGEALPATPDEVPMKMAMPAFLLSELTTAFQMGVIVLLPFLVVDLAVSSLLMSMGMMMVPPSVMSLPIKLLLFVLVDGWTLVAGSLLRSFS
jgi:flagellar biosynthesis protein FliP